MSLFIIVKLFFYFLGRKLGAWPVWATSSMCWWGRTDSSRLFRALRSPAPPPTATAAVGLRLYSSCNSCNNRPPHRYAHSCRTEGYPERMEGIMGKRGPGYSVPDPPDPHVFEPPGNGSGSVSQMYGSGSGSISQMYESGSGFFYMIPTVLWLLLDFLSLKNDENVPSKSNQQKNFIWNSFFVGVLKVNDENIRIRIRIRIH